jgi:hypothetical protein
MMRIMKQQSISADTSTVLPHTLHQLMSIPLVDNDQVRIIQRFVKVECF